MNEEVSIVILFFAKSRELAGISESVLQLQLREIKCSDLLDKICNQYNLTIIKDNIILALNGEYCDNLNEILVLRNGDELAIIPPISGG